MKTNFFKVVFLLITLATVFSSCKKDDDDSSINISDLYGTWVCVKAEGNGVSQTFSVSDESDKCIFYKDGTIYTYDYDATGTLSYANGVLKITHYTGSITSNFNVKTLNSSTMVLEWNNVSYTYKKI